MFRRIRGATLHALRSSGISGAVAQSRWRRERLLILCYHLVSVRDEHEWRPTLYMTPDGLRRRFQLIQDSGCTVLALDEAVQRLYAGKLPVKSVAITFDDGGNDFYRFVYPLTREYQFPVTVYQTTYYCDVQKPVFHLACSYMLWRKRESMLPETPQLGITRPVDLRPESNRQRVVDTFVGFAKVERLNACEKDDLARRLAGALEFDYEEFRRERILTLMPPTEVAEVAAHGVDVQLHTHRHRTPNNEQLFRREIRENRKRLEEITGRAAKHFCYPLGKYEMDFLPWLRAEDVISGTTCEAGLASRTSNPLLLPRYVDNKMKSEHEFEAWLDGAATFLARRPASERVNEQ